MAGRKQLGHPSERGAQIVLRTRRAAGDGGSHNGAVHVLAAGLARKAGIAQEQAGKL